MSIADLRDRYKQRQTKAVDKTGGGAYINEAGRFLVEMTATELRSCLDAEKKKRGILEKNWKAGIFNFKLITSDNANYPVGSTWTWFVKDPEETNLSDVERLMWSLQGYNPGVIKGLKTANPSAFADHQLMADLWADASYNDSAALEALGFEPGFIVGLRAQLETKMIITATTNRPFTVHNWSPTADAASAPFPIPKFD